MLLNKAGRLAAEQHLIMNNSNIPPSMAVKMVKPMAREQGKLVKRLRTGTSGPITYQGTAEPEGMVDAPVENLLKQILKGVKQEPAAPVIIKRHLPRQVLKRRKRVPNHPFHPNRPPVKRQGPPVKSRPCQLIPRVS